MPSEPAHGGSRLTGAVLRASGAARRQISRGETDLARTRTIYATASRGESTAHAPSVGPQSTSRDSHHGARRGTPVGARGAASAESVRQTRALGRDFGLLH